MTNNEAFELTDVETLVMKLVASDRDYWAKTAQSLLRGVVLHLGYQEGRVFTLEQVALALARPVDELCQELIKSEHPMVAAAGREMKQRSATDPGARQKQSTSAREKQTIRGSRFRSIAQCLGRREQRSSTSGQCRRLV